LLKELEAVVQVCTRVVYMCV